MLIAIYGEGTSATTKGQTLIANTNFFSGFLLATYSVGLKFNLFAMISIYRDKESLSPFNILIMCPNQTFKKRFIIFVASYFT